jgi:hypothetical protein
VKNIVQHVLHTFKIIAVEKKGIHPVEDGNANNSGCENFHVLSPSAVAKLTAKH